MKIDQLRSKTVQMIRYKSAAQISLEGFAPFCDRLDEKNRWIILGRVLPWDDLAGVYHRAMSAGKGRPSVDARTVIGAMIIKHKLRLDDRGTIEMITENPYMQWFCGLSAFSSKPVFDASLFVTLRKRMGAKAFDRMNQAILDQAGRADKANAKTHKKDGDRKKDQDLPASDPTPSSGKGQLKVDATVAPQKIAYPTDLGLLNEAREQTESLIDALCVRLSVKTKPRTYRKVARKSYLAVIRKRKRSWKELRKAIGKQLGYLRRNLRTVEKLWDIAGTPWPLKYARLRQYWVVQEHCRQQLQMHTERSHSVAHRIVSLHQPHVRPIVRGKAAANVEFGAKLDVALYDGIAWPDHIGWDAHNESEWLMHHVECYKERTGHYPEAVNVDGIYGTRENRSKLKELGIRFIGRALGRPTAESLTPEAKRKRRKEMAQRNHIEGKFGQGKSGYGLDRIKAKRKDTSESWIAAIFLVMNLREIIRQLPDLPGAFFYALLRMLMPVSFGKKRIDFSDQHLSALALRPTSHLIR